MGVGKGFWDVLKPVARLESLDSLRGKVLAVDLSFWMIQLLSRLKGVPLRKPHIRLLFFRTIHLVAKIGAFPVFVADGDPPPLKLEVRLNRFSRISGVPLNSFLGDSNCNVSCNRNSLFTDSVDECVKLLELLGIPVLRAKHEAEALCAELQRKGLVNACVTPDSDAFLYGAEHVIKIFQADLKNPHVESYLMRDIESLGLHREHLVALALLAGCDYNVSGVPGIGCQNAVRLIKHVPKDQVFNRLQDWGAGRFTTEPGNEGLTVHFTDGFEKEGGPFKSGDSAALKKEPHCSSCGHPGTKKTHTKVGCEKCQLETASSGFIDEQGCRPKVQGFKCTCEYCLRRESLKGKTKQEGWKLKVCQKISAARGFPNKDIIRIFMSPEQDTLGGDKRPSLAWRSPHLETLEEFLEEHLHWDKRYVRRKLLPLLSFYCLKDTAAIRRLATPSLITPSINAIYVPHSIQRIKISFSKPLYRLRWTRSAAASTQDDWLGLHKAPSSYDKKTDDDLDIMASDLRTESLNDILLFTTDEDMNLVKEAYPDLVLQFEREQDLRKSKKKGASRKQTIGGNLSSKQLQITSFFQARKESYSHDEKENPESAVERSSVDDKTQVMLIQGLEMHQRAGPQLEGAVCATHEFEVDVKKRVMDSSETRAPEVVIFHDDHDVLEENFKEDQYHYLTVSAELVSKANKKSNAVQITELVSKANKKSSAVQTRGYMPGHSKVSINKDLKGGIKQEPPDVILIDDSDVIEVYPCKANRLAQNHDSPGSQQSRERFSLRRKPKSLEPIHNHHGTPPLPSWREFYERDKTKPSDDLLKRRSSKVSARRALFS